MNDITKPSTQIIKNLGEEKDIYDMSKPPQTYITASDRHYIERSEVFLVNVLNILGTFIASLGSVFLGAYLTITDAAIKNVYEIVSIILFAVGLGLYALSMYYMLYKWEREKKLVKL